MKNTKKQSKHFFKALKHMERHSTLLILIEMQINTILRYHFSPNRLVKIKKKTTHYLQGYGETNLKTCMK